MSPARMCKELGRQWVSGKQNHNHPAVGHAGPNVVKGTAAATAALLQFSPLIQRKPQLARSKMSWRTSFCKNSSCNGNRDMSILSRSVPKLHSSIDAAVAIDIGSPAPAASIVWCLPFRAVATPLGSSSTWCACCYKAHDLAGHRHYIDWTHQQG